MTGPPCFVETEEKKKFKNRIRRTALTRLFEQVLYVENQETMKFEESKINNKEIF